jgi:hypothetical protein
MNTIVKSLKYILFTLAVLILIYGFGRVMVVTHDSYIHLEREPYTTNQTFDTITIKWNTTQKENSILYFGEDESNLQKIELNKEVTKHFIKLDGLKECTKYYYKVESKYIDINNQDRSFRTLCKQMDFQRIWVIGDSGQAGVNQEMVYNEFLNYIDFDYSKLDAWLLLGDNAYRSGTQDQFNYAMFRPYKDIVKRLTPWILMGNHDDRRFAFDEIFDFPKNGQSGGVPSGTEYYYSIDDGNLHLVMLDSERIDRDFDSTMAKWLERDLAANKKPWVVVAMHSPPYTKGGHDSDDDYDSNGKLRDMRENFVPIFDKYGVDLVLSGHSHDYERSKLIYGHYGKSDTFSKDHIIQDSDDTYDKTNTKKGTIYVVAGSSSKLDGAALDHPALPFAFEQMGSVVLEITPTSLVSKFINKDGEIKDQFKIIKEKKEKDE